MKFGFLITDDSDWCDKFLIRILGFTILSIYGGRSYGLFGITILGFWFEIEF